MDIHKQLMHKKLENDLISLAHDILKMKNRADIFALKEKSHALFERISLLAFIEEFINTTPQSTASKEQLIATIENSLQVKDSSKENEIISKKEVVKPIQSVEISSLETVIDESKIIDDNVFEQFPDKIEKLIFSETNNSSNYKNDVKDVGERKTPTLEEELQDTISVDIMANLFENVHPTSLNDRLVNSIQIGLNDRIAFVKHLFNGAQEDFNRVVSQLNTFKTENEAKAFIKNVVKPDYDWTSQEELERRFLEIIERKFM